MCSHHSLQPGVLRSIRLLRMHKLRARNCCFSLFPGAVSLPPNAPLRSTRAPQKPAPAGLLPGCLSFGIAQCSTSSLKLHSSS